MKKYIILLLLIGVTGSLPAQNKAIEQLFQKYSDRDGFTSVVITKNMFQLFANVDGRVVQGHILDGICPPCPYRTTA